MLSYLIRRLLIGVITLLLITFIVYALIRHMPGTPLMTDPSVISLDKKLNEEDLKRMERAYGLDKPWYVAYFQWLGNVVVYGDLGDSFRHNRAPVREVIGEHLPPTLWMMTTSLVITYLLSVPLGLYSTARRNLLDERIVSTTLYMLYATPTFVVALLLLIVFSLYLQDTPFELRPDYLSVEYDQMSFGEKVVDRVKHMILPVLCFTYGGLAYYSRFVKANMEEVIRQDYIRTARAKGAGPLRVLIHHAFRNTLIPFVTMLGLTLPALVGGSIVLEYIFAWKGIGWLFLEAIDQRNYTIVMGLTLLFSVATLAGQLLADVLYAFVDPRVTYS